MGGVRTHSSSRHSTSDSLLVTKARAAPLEATVPLAVFAFAGSSGAEGVGAAAGSAAGAIPEGAGRKSGRGSGPSSPPPLLLLGSACSSSSHMSKKSLRSPTRAGLEPGALRQGERGRGYIRG